MASKKELLKNLRDYTPEEIAEAVKAGIVTIYELAKESDGAFTPLLRKQVKDILDKPTPIDVASSSSEAGQNSQIPTIETTELPVSNIIQTDTVESASIENESITEDTVSYIDEDVIDNKGMFKRPFNFMTGRIRRMEYWLSMLIFYAYAFIVGMFVGAANGSEGVMYLLLIPGYIFIWAQGSKRCHDRGNSGWYQLIPFYGLWMAFADSEPSNNEYGNNPKE